MSPEKDVLFPDEAAGDGSVMRRSRSLRQRAEGFTLLEVMVSLTILTLAMAIAYGAFTTALTSWSSGLSRGRKEQVARIALERMAQQLKSAIPATVAAAGGRPQRPAFEGGEDHIRFVTILSTGVDTLPVQVSYSMEEVDGERRMVYQEYPWPDKNFFEVGEPVKEEVLDEIVGLAITLRPREESGIPVGEEELSPEDEDTMPGGVDISLRIEGDEDDRYATSVSLQSAPWR